MERYIGECKKALSNVSLESGFSVTIDDDHFYIKRQLIAKRPSLMKIKFLKISLQRVYTRFCITDSPHFVFRNVTRTTLPQVDFFEAVAEILDSVFCENNNFSAEKSRLKDEIESLKEGTIPQIRYL